MGELTKYHPKPTLKIGNKTVIERIIDNLHLHGVFEILVNVHYLPVKIITEVTSNALYYYEPQLLGHEGTIVALKEWLKDEKFFVINGDTISTVNFTEMRQIHRENTISVLMDQWRCAGVWLYSPEYFGNPK